MNVQKFPQYNTTKRAGMAQKGKKLFPLSVGITRRKLKMSTYSRAFSYERELKGFNAPFVQTVRYQPKKRTLDLAITNPAGAVVSSITSRIDIALDKKKVARVAWGETNERYRNKGLMGQMLVESIELFKKMKVDKIQAFVTSGKHEEIYNSFGFVALKIPEGTLYTLEIK